MPETTVKRTKGGNEHFAEAWDDRGLVTRWGTDEAKAKPASEDDAAKIARTHERRKGSPVGTLVFLDGDKEVNRVDGKGGEQGQEVTVKVQADNARVKELEAENARLKAQVAKAAAGPESQPDKPEAGVQMVEPSKAEAVEDANKHGHRRNR